MIKNFTIYGERCSGTNLLEAIITGSSYFHSNNKEVFDIPLTWDFGYKHWFGFNDEHIKQKGQETLFLSIVRDPYDWIISLFKKKHHIPAINYSVDNFLLGEWYSIDHKITSPTYREEILVDRNWKTGKRYRNIFELRRNKLEYLLDIMPSIAPNYILIKYEDLCKNHIKVINDIASKYNLKIINKECLKPKIQNHYDLHEKFVEIINKNIDWNMEARIGYHKSLWRPIQTNDTKNTQIYFANGLKKLKNRGLTRRY